MDTETMTARLYEVLYAQFDAAVADTPEAKRPLRSKAWEWCDLELIDRIAAEFGYTRDEDAGFDSDEQPWAALYRSEGQPPIVGWFNGRTRVGFNTDIHGIFVHIA